MITCIDTFDYTLVSAGLDEKLFVWDVRMMARYIVCVCVCVCVYVCVKTCMILAHSPGSALLRLLSSVHIYTHMYVQVYTQCASLSLSVIICI